MTETNNEKQLPLYVDIWKESSNSLRHFDNLYWHTIRHYTGLIALFAGGAGAAVSIGVLPVTARLFVSASLLMIGGIVAFVAWYVVQRQGLYIGYAQKSQAIFERNVLNSLSLDKETADDWKGNRKFDSEIKRDPQIQGPVRKIVPISFFGLGVIFIMVFIIEVGIAIKWSEVLLPDSENHQEFDVKSKKVSISDKQSANKAN